MKYETISFDEKHHIFHIALKPEKVTVNIETSYNTTYYEEFYFDGYNSLESLMTKLLSLEVFRSFATDNIDDIIDFFERNEFIIEKYSFNRDEVIDEIATKRLEDMETYDLQQYFLNGQVNSLEDLSNKELKEILKDL